MAANSCVACHFIFLLHSIKSYAEMSHKDMVFSSPWSGLPVGKTNSSPHARVCVFPLVGFGRIADVPLQTVIKLLPSSTDQQRKLGLIKI